MILFIIDYKFLVFLILSDIRLRIKKKVTINSINPKKIQ